MKQLLALLLFVPSLCLAQSVTLPYNPDVNADSAITSTDLLGLLPIFGGFFTPEEVLIDGMTINEYLLLVEENGGALPVEGSEHGQMLYWNGEEWVASVRFGSMAWLTTGAHQLHERLDLVLLAVLRGDATEVALYAVAVGVVQRLRVVALALASALFPHVAGMSTEEGARFAARVTRVALAGAPSIRSAPLRIHFCSRARENSGNSSAAAWSRRIPAWFESARAESLMRSFSISSDIVPQRPSAHSRESAQRPRITSLSRRIPVSFRHGKTSGSTPASRFP